MIKSFKQYINEGVDYNIILKREVPSILQSCNDYLKQFDLSVYFDDEYDLEDDDWVAVYSAGSVVDNDGEMTIGLCYDAFINFWNEENCTEREAEEQVAISIWHEVGHGLVDWIREEISNYYDMMEQDPEDIPEHIDKIMDEFYEKWEHVLTNENEDDEEDIVEEFGISMGGDIPPRNRDLEEMIEDFKKYIDAEW